MVSLVRAGGRWCLFLRAASSAADAGAVGSCSRSLFFFGSLRFGRAGGAFFLLGSTASLLIRVDFAGACLRGGFLYDFLLSWGLLLCSGVTVGSIGFLRATSSCFGFLRRLLFDIILGRSFVSGLWAFDGLFHGLVISSLLFHGEFILVLYNVVTRALKCDSWVLGFGFALNGVAAF